MPRRKRRTKKPEPAAPVPAAELPKTKKRRRRPRRVSEPGPVLAEPKTVTQLIFESQRSQLDRLNEELRSKVTG